MYMDDLPKKENNNFKNFALFNPHSHDDDLAKSVKKTPQPMRMSWMNPWAFCPLLISAVGILLTTEVPSVNQYSYLPLNNPLVIY